MAATKIAIANIALSKIGAKAITSFSQSGSNEARAVNAVYDDILLEVLCEHPWSFAQKRFALIATVPDDTSRTIDDSVYAPVTITGISQDFPAIVTAAAHGLVDGDWIKITGVQGMTEINDIFYIVQNASDDDFELTDTNGDEIDATVFDAYTSLGQIQKADEMVTTDNYVPVVYDKPSDLIKPIKMSVNGAVMTIERDKIISDTVDLKIIYTFLNTDTTQYFPKFVQALATRLAAELAFAITNSVSKAKELMSLYVNEVLPTAVGADSTQGTPDTVMQDEWLDSMNVGSGPFATTGLTWHPF